MSNREVSQEGTKKLPSYRTKFNSLIPKRIGQKEMEQTASQSLLERKEVQALENQLATLRLEHENQLQKHCLI